MPLHVAINHKSIYRYERPIELGPQVIRLRPAPHSRTKILSYSLKIRPVDHFLNWQQDPFGNFLARAVFEEKVSHLSVEVDLVADMAVINPFDFFLEPEADNYPFTYDEETSEELKPYLAREPAGPLLKAFLKDVPLDEIRAVDFLVHLNQRVQNLIKYLVRMEPGIQATEETLTLKSGSCRDSAWLLVQILRHLGLAARFVSGYLIQLKADVKSLDGPSGAENDFTDLHAWAEVYLPGAGWVGLDPTSGLFTGEGHIPLAATPKPTSAAPITGMHEPAKVEFEHEMSVTRVLETPRVTKPYTDEQWQAIVSEGRRTDKKLKDDDVRLTMGGEPTFVSIDDPDGDEWNTAAVGPTKRHRAEVLIKRLKARFAPEGLLHYGQGKWYPGEQLPRWAFSLYWRGDGRPLWTNDKLIAEEKADHEPTAEQAKAFAEELARKLNIEPTYVIEAYEDPWHFMQAERQLPENVDLSSAKLKDPQERARIARVVERGLNKPAGMILPVQRWQARDGGRHWVSEKWTTRSKQIILMPGDSPIGFRLPINSLPHIPADQYPHVIPQDPFDARSDGQMKHRPSDDWEEAHRDQRVDRQSEQVLLDTDSSRRLRHVRAAMTFEPRDGRLCIFMPPVETIEDYFDITQCIEETAEQLSIPVHVEGYEPPADHRLNVIKVTPDPGVIEVNVHPAHSWDEMVDVTTALYEEAYFSRLGTEKFMLDGRHSGTGGGNHIVVGGKSPADSPFLRRPDLLQSLIAFWQNHPSLSYLFSGLFIGPTSQAPRIDEARNDSLHELELAFQEVPDVRAGETAAPWLVDRIFRHLLIDVTGNTHRSEICIDKLYSPDGPTGRLGLVEFRAFEMPPHARMSLAQQLLLRCLISRFWKKPYKAPLVRWGTTIHDQFMLPYFVWRDFRHVIEDMVEEGYQLDVDWFLPHFEFRFPRFGDVNFEGVVIELRQALEPWHVLGEQGAVGGTARYVDSSLERLQVEATGLNPDRYNLACNGALVPLTPTGAQGSYVGGIRFRAWQPPNCLHPTIPTDAPLTIDLYDTWTKRSVAGCTYHVAHPGGRGNEDFPVNAYEAESRRLARFQSFGYTPGASEPPRSIVRKEHPSTLDLRWRIA